MANTSDAPANARGGLSLARLERPLRILIFLLIALAIVELYHLASTLVLQLTNIALIFMFAAVIAMLVTPIVDRVQSLPLLRGRRGLAVLILYGAIVVLVGLAAALLAPTVVADASKLGQQVPALEDAAQRALDAAQASLRAFGFNLSYRIPRGGASLGGDISPASLTSIGGIVSPLVNTLLVIVVSIYLTSQGRELVATARKLFPAQERLFDFTMLAVGAAVAAYVRAQLLMSLLMGLYTGITLSLLGVHYAAALGVAVFFLEMLPLVGAPIGFLLAIVVAATQSLPLAVEATVVSLVGHAIEAYILGPRISGKVTRIHPLAAMGALLIGAELGGILGALLAIPITVIGNIFLGAVYVSSQGRDGLQIADTPGPVGVSDLPSLADQISVNTEDVGPEMVADVVTKKAPARKRRARPVP
ncbi:MAG TPA: AI-2E family transporter [Candidatus Dormibacteraeota bacterium]|nr:AI-2E family transporter [Candidatus Dormibacteraeota bacterium]